MCFWLFAMRANSARVAGSLTATTDQVCRLELVAADWAAAISVSKVPAGSGSDLNPRTDR